MGRSDLCYHVKNPNTIPRIPPSPPKKNTIIEIYIANCFSS